MPQVQLVVVQAGVSCTWFEAGKSPGDVVWVHEAAARHLLENGICKWPELRPTTGPENAKPAGPSNAKPAGPSETKTTASAELNNSSADMDKGEEPAEEPPERKPSGEAPHGRLTASPLSSGPGAARLSSASAAALVSPQRR